MTPSPNRLADLEHPWLGLESFSEATQAFFFGRTEEIAELHLRWRSHPLLVLYGRSGLGKTSILNAGLLPRLREEGKKPLLVRLRYEEPSADPVAQLLGALFAEGIASNEWLAQLRTKLQLPLPDDPASLLWLRVHNRAEPPAITHLILDQFEEVFTVGMRRAGSDTAVRDALAILLQGALPPPISQLMTEHDNLSDHFDTDSAPVRILLALRDDFVYALNRWRRHLSALGQNSYELRSLRGAAAFDAVYKPGALRCANSNLPPIIDEETASRIVRFVAKKGADVSLEEIEAVPPILSLLCRELNERRLLATPPAQQITFREGDADIGGIISAFYERCLAGKPEAVRIFVEEELVSVSGARLPQDEGSILRVFTEGCEIPGAIDGRRASGFGDANAARAGLRELVSDRLLNSLGGEVPVYELIHDLIAGVAEKSRTAREQRFEKEEAERRAQNEKASKEQAEKETRRARNTTALVSVFLVVAIIAGLIGYLQKRKAEAATARATQTRNAAEDVIGFMTFALRDKLQTIGRLDLLQDVNERVQNYYQSLGPEGETPEMLRQRSAMFANQGNVAFEQGDLDEAEKKFRAFLEIAQKLSAQDPKNILWQRDLALAYGKVGGVRQLRGDAEAALTNERAAFAINQELVRQNPKDSGARFDLGWSLARLGDLARTSGDLPGAMKNFQEASTLQQELTEEAPADIARSRALCYSLDALGDIQSTSGQLDDAIESYERSYDLRDTFAQRDPNDLLRQWDFSLSQMNLARTRRAQGDAASAARYLNDCLAIRKRLCLQDPKNTNWLRGLAETYENLGQLAVTRGDSRTALANFTETLAIRERLVKRDPNNTVWNWDRSGTLMEIGDVKSAEGKLAEATENFTASLDIRQALLRKNSGNAAGEREICVTYDRLGDVQQTRGHLPEALVHYRQFADTMERLVRQDQSNAEFRNTLSFAYGRIGVARANQGDFDGGMENFEKALSIRQALAEKDPQNADWQWEVVDTLGKIARLLHFRGNDAEALEKIQTADAIAQRFLPKDPNSAEFRWQVSMLALARARSESAQNKLAEALKNGAVCLDLRQQIFDRDSGNADWLLGLAAAENAVGKIQLRQEDAAGAEKTFANSRAHLETLAVRAPENAYSAVELAASTQGTADAQRLRGDLTGALKNYHDALRVREAVAQRDQSNAFWQADLAQTCWRMGETQLALDARSRPDAVKLLERGREILRDLKTRASLTSEQQEWLDGIEGDLAKLH
ncbi:MAG: tetratricopeptide repeat protein [Verrucomicrobiota bacterium]|nr:tetratricopeptide repeat protein [Verrucomicrobiota bacterium]